jgi:hypothetical protein
MRRSTSPFIPLALIVAGVGVPLLVLAPLGPESSSSPSAGPQAAPSPTPTPTEFVPPTYVEGNHVVMPVTFPDGTAAELVYPPELDLASFSVYPNTQGDLDRGSCSSDFFISTAKRATGVSGAGPVAVLPGTAGNVELWRGDKDHGGYLLIFEFGRWYVALYCNRGPGDETHAVWAASLSGHETPEGYLVLEASAPLQLHPWRDVGGPALFISDRSMFIELVAGSTNTAEDRDPSDGVVQWRFQEGHVRLYANAFSKGAKDVLQGLVDGLEIRNVREPA